MIRQHEEQALRFIERAWDVLARTPYANLDPEYGPRCPTCRAYGHSPYCPILLAIGGLNLPIRFLGFCLMERWAFFECQEPITL